MFRFIARTRNKRYATTNDLSAEEIDVSRLDWMSHVQQRYACDNKDAFIKEANNLRFYVDGGVRCRGRLAKPVLPYNTKFPIF